MLAIRRVDPMDIGVRPVVMNTAKEGDLCAPVELVVGRVAIFLLYYNYYLAVETAA